MADPVTTLVVTQAVQILISILKGNVSRASAETKLHAWFHDRLSGRAKEALYDLEAAPSEDNLADLRKQLARQIEDEPRLRAELQELLPVGDEAEKVRAVGEAIRAGNDIIGRPAF